MVSAIQGRDVGFEEEERGNPFGRLLEERWVFNWICGRNGKTGNQEDVQVGALNDWEDGSVIHKTRDTRGRAGLDLGC